jgi:hypothetical protein
MNVTMDLNPRTMADGSILVLSVRFRPEEDSPENPTVYAHVAIKARGFWYLTGKAPQAAGWGAIEGWLRRENRELVKVEIVTQTSTIWPSAIDTSQA